MNSAVHALERAVRTTGAPDFAWVVEHAPGGDLGPFWDSLTEARDLWMLAQVFVPRRTLVRVGAALIATLPLPEDPRVDAPRDDPRVRDALAAAVAWSRGDAPDLATAEEWLVDAEGDFFQRDSWMSEYYAARAAHKLVSLAQGQFPHSALTDDVADAHARRATARARSYKVWGKSFKLANARYAKWLRKRLPVPTLAALGAP